MFVVASAGLCLLVVSHATTKMPEHVGDTVEFSCTTPRAIYTSSMVKPAHQLQNVLRVRSCCARGIWVASSTMQAGCIAYGLSHAGSL